MTKTISETIKLAIKEAKATRDATPNDVHHLNTYHFFNGKVVALQDLLRELVTKTHKGM